MLNSIETIDIFISIYKTNIRRDCVSISIWVYFNKNNEVKRGNVRGKNVTMYFLKILRDLILNWLKISIN